MTLKNENVQVVNETKLLGTIINDNLTWDANTELLVKKSNQRMQLLKKVASFGTSLDELKNIYILFIRSILEQSPTVWHSSLTN